MRVLTTILLLAAISATGQSQFGPAPVVSPEITDGNTVTFRLYAPDAGEVTLSGTWMEGWGASLPIQANDTGLWTITVHNLEPEMYTYTYSVNGVRMTDPSNPLTVRDGRNNQSMLMIPAEGHPLYSYHDAPRGNLEKVWYRSLTLSRRMYVYTPPGYRETTEGYPVLYLLHGGGGDEDAWTTLGRTPQIMDNLIAKGLSRPMIVVMTNGNPTQSAALTEQIPLRSRSEATPAGMAGGQFERSLVNDVIPWIESNYRTLPGKDNRAVAGLSMGGLQTMSLSFTFPDTFAWYGIMSMGLVDMTRFGIEDNYEARKASLKKLWDTDPRLYWIACGTEDFLYNSVVELISYLEGQEFPHIYYETGGGHTWDRWRHYLSELAPLLFR